MKGAFAVAWGVPLVMLATAVTTTAAADEAEATDLLRQGIALRREHRDAEALTAFEAANRVEPSPIATAQIGLALFALRRWEEAESHLKAALYHADDPWIVRHQSALAGALSAVASHLGWLQIETIVPGAQVVVEGRTYPVGAAPVRVSAEVVSFEVRADGYRPATGQAVVLPGAVVQMPVTLEPEPPRESAVVSAPPTHEEPTAERGQKATEAMPRAPKAATPAGNSAWTVAAPLLAVGTATLGVGVVFGGLALSAKKTRDDHCIGSYCDATGLAADDTARTRAAVATAGVGIGLAAIAGGVGWLLVSRPQRVQLGPAVGALMGFSVKGQW